MAPVPSLQEMLQTVDNAINAGSVYVMQPKDRDSLRDNVNKYWNLVTGHDALVVDRDNLKVRLDDCLAKNSCDCDEVNTRLKDCNKEKTRITKEKNRIKEEKDNIIHELKEKLKICELKRKHDRDELETKLNKCRNKVWSLEEKVERLKNRRPVVIRVKEYVTQYVYQPYQVYVYQPCYNVCSWGWNRCRRW